MRRLLYAIIIISLSIVNPVLGSDDSAVLCKPDKIVIDKELYKIEVEPIQIPWRDGWGPKSFRLKIFNKNTNNINILWDSTYYLRDGKVDGIFCEFKGKTLRESETILPEQSIERNIAPENLARFDYTFGTLFRTGNTFFNREFPLGRNGIMLNMIIDDKKNVEQAEIDFIRK